MLSIGLSLCHTILSVNHFEREKTFENILGKGWNAGNQHFLLFLQSFLPNQRHQPSSELHSICHLQMLWIWTSLTFSHVIKSSPFPKRQILDSFKLKEFIERVCRWQFKIWLNGRKFSKRVGNTVGKGEIACYERFLLFPVFSKFFIADTQKPGLIREGIKSRISLLGKELTFYDIQKLWTLYQTTKS